MPEKSDADTPVMAGEVKGSPRNSARIAVFVTIGPGLTLQADMSLPPHGGGSLVLSFENALTCQGFGF